VNILPCLAAIAAALLCSHAYAQGSATASRALGISVFTGASAVDTGLNSGRNVGITVGADLTLRRRFGLNPAVEFRGTYPIEGGQADSQSNALLGIRLSGTLNRLHPYGNFLFGRGRIDYAPPLLDPQKLFYYVQSTSSVLSPGGGIVADLNDFFALRADAQLQRYDSPVTVSGHLYAVPITLGLVYRLSFDRRRR